MECRLNKMTCVPKAFKWSFDLCTSELMFVFVVRRIDLFSFYLIDYHKLRLARTHSHTKRGTHIVRGWLDRVEVEAIALYLCLCLCWITETIVQITLKCVFWLVQWRWWLFGNLNRWISHYIGFVDREKKSVCLYVCILHLHLFMVIVYECQYFGQLCFGRWQQLHWNCSP